MKIDAASEIASASSTAKPAVTSDPQISGQACTKNADAGGFAVVYAIDPICESVSPPDPSQERPSWLNVGHAPRTTNTIIRMIPSASRHATAPSTRSARLSLHGLRRRFSIPRASLGTLRAL
jgi:hypothetical protein